MNTHWQRMMPVSGLVLIWLATVVFSARAGIPTDRQTTTRTSSEIHTTPLSDTQAYTLYLPFVMKPPGMLYGTVTEFGLPAANVGIGLKRCLTWGTAPGGERFCATWDTYSTTTDHNGWYAFIDPPTLVISPGQVYSQTYLASWHNYPSVPNRLDYWESRVIDSYTEGDIVNLGNFDIGAITLLTPPAGSDVHFPVTFQWIPRHNVPTDNYNVCVFGGMIIPKYDPGDFVCLGPFAYTNQVTMADPFIGIDYGYGYNWYVSVPDETGGVGYSRNVPFTFASP